MLIFLVFSAHYVEQFLGEGLGTVNKIDRHIVNFPGLNLFLSKPPCSFFLLFLQLFFFGLSLFDNSFFSSDIFRINSWLIITVR